MEAAIRETIFVGRVFHRSRGGSPKSASPSMRLNLGGCDVLVVLLLAINFVAPIHGEELGSRARLAAIPIERPR
jgi:hypothetical protein